MARIEPVAPGKAPDAAKPVLAEIEKGFGRVPNIFATVAKSPATLKALAGMFEALGGGVLAGIPGEAINLRVAQLNGCEYCLAAHVGSAKAAGASDEQIAGFRKGTAEDPKLAAILDLVTAMVLSRCSDIDAEFEAARVAGATDEDLIELIGLVALTVFTNYTNLTCGTEVDFPAAPPL